MENTKDNASESERSSLNAVVQHPFVVFKVVPEAYPSRGCGPIDEAALDAAMNRSLRAVSERNRRQMPPDIYQRMLNAKDHA